MNAKTYRIHISGQVQGVGFRPYVYNLAQTFGVKGTVSNNAEGVVIFAQGVKANIDTFYKTLIAKPPPVSKIEAHTISEVASNLFSDFAIIPSTENGKLNLKLTPDFGICDACKDDIIDTSNRRYNYPFITCVHCGPRWAITQTFPFERHNTNMDTFTMCDACKDEYINPADRRFHSQTNSCATCGIQLYLVDREENKIAANHLVFKPIAALLGAGAIIAIKNTSGYLLCCDARNNATVTRLRQRKNRPQKPFALLYPSLDLLKTHFDITAEEETALTSAERPIVIVNSAGLKPLMLSPAVAPQLTQLGVMLPNSGILQLLANAIDFPIVATSGNLSGSPIVSRRDDALTKLKSVADYFLQHDLEINNPQDDSVIKLSKVHRMPVLFRRSRGYAPNYFDTTITANTSVMALGAHLKSTVAFLPNNHIYISQYLGHLDYYEVYNRFVTQAADFMTMFQVQPKVVLVDKHPSYQSTVYGEELAKTYNAKLIKIQHHKAHFASVLGEHHLFNTSDPVLGVIWDGTGYGDDANIWGGEFFTYQHNEMQRMSHFEYFDWIAGDKMAKEPRLSLFSILKDAEASVLSEKYTPTELNIYKVLQKRNTLKTSSVGRLFDAVASLLNICNENTYEGEAAIRLENSVGSYNLKHCICYANLTPNGCVPTKKIFNAIAKDLERGAIKSQIICNFLYTLVSNILQVAERNNCKKIACSGGVFQNTILIDMLKTMAGDRFELFFNRNLSPNDENISLGQLMYYLHGVDAHHDN